MKPTCTGRSVSVGTIDTAAYRWNSDIASSAVTSACSGPPKRLAAPSSSSTKRSAARRRSSLTASACTDDPELEAIDRPGPATPGAADQGLSWGI